MTKLDIFNSALALIPHDRRINDSEEDSTEALRCREQWDAARRRVFAAHPWGFLTRSIFMDGAVEGPGAPLPFSYPRPSGAVRIIGAFAPNGQQVRADSLNGRIYSTSPCAHIRYIPDDDTDYDAWPPWFMDAVVAELCARIAGLVTGSGELQQGAGIMAASRLDIAKNLDSHEIRWSGTDGLSYVKARR